MDGPFMSDAAGPPYELPPEIQRIVDAVLNLEADLLCEIDAQRERAELAESRARELEDLLARRDDDLKRLRTKSRSSQNHLIRGVRDYVEATAEAQGALLGLTRGLLGAPQVPTGAGSSVPEQGESSAAERELDHWFAAEEQVVEGSVDGCANDTSARDRDGVDEISAEHRIIDLQNEIDMRRLDAPTYVQSLRSRL